MNSSPLRRQVRQRRSCVPCWMVTVSSSRPTMRALVKRCERHSGQEVLEHGLFAVAPGCDVEDPALTHTASEMTRLGHFRRRRSQGTRAPVCREP